MHTTLSSLEGSVVLCTLEYLPDSSFNLEGYFSSDQLIWIKSDNMTILQNPKILFI